MPEPDRLRSELKRLLVTSLNLTAVEPTGIDDDARLVGGELGLDSVDVLELVVAIEQEYGVKLDGDAMKPEIFTSIATLADFLHERMVEAR